MTHTTDNRIRPHSSGSFQPKTSIFFSFGEAKPKTKLSPDEIIEIQTLIDQYGKYTKNQNK